MKYTSFDQVPVWQKSHALALEIYRSTNDFPKSEMYGLTSQLRRSATSIPANIAEGFFRNSTKELIQFLYITRGSLGETRYHLLLAKDLRYMTEEKYGILANDYEDVGKQLNGWIKSLKPNIH